MLIKSSSRRAFLRQSVIATAGFSLLGCGNDNSDGPSENENIQRVPGSLPLLNTIGLQLWTVREPLAEDPQATLSALSEMGYQQVELMDTRQIATFKPICDNLGLEINSSFMQWSTITGRWDLVPNETEPFEFNQVLDQAGEGGLSHLVFGYLTPGERETADDWKRLADQLNRAAETAKSAGIQMAYHNHNFEWSPVEGTTGFDILLDRLDGDLMPFELDVAWVAMAGKDPREMLGQVKDRTKLLHLKNLKDLDQPYLTLEEVPENSFEELNDGQLDTVVLMELAAEVGVDYVFVEQDDNHDPDPLGSVRTSLDFLRSITG